MLIRKGLAILIALGGTLNLSAAVCDLTTAGSSCTLNGAQLFEAGIAPTGTGVIDSFVRIQGTGNEQGYNTDFRPLQYDELTAANFTRSLLLTAVPIVTISGTAYREFSLDINQVGSDPLLTLNRIIITTWSAPNLSGATAVDGTAYAGTAANLFPVADAPVYDSGLGNTIELNYNLNAGSGKGDMFLYVPSSLFSGQYVYLYSEFGFGPNDTNDGFEEWAVRTAGPVVPEPSTLLILCGFIGAGAIVQRRRANASKAA